MERLPGEMRRRCERKTVTMAKCAPINCHFVLADDEKECMSTNKLANVSVRVYKEVQLDFTPEMEALYMLFER